MTTASTEEWEVIPAYIETKVTLPDGRAAIRREPVEVKRLKGEVVKKRPEKTNVDD
jgi:hypothetical protein